MILEFEQSKGYAEVWERPATVARVVALPWYPSQRQNAAVVWDEKVEAGREAISTLMIYL